MTETAKVTLPDGRVATVSGPTRDAVLARIDALRLESSDITTEPFVLPTRERLIQHSEYEDPQILNVPHPGAEIAATGVDVVTGAPAGMRSLASFAKNENAAIAYLEGQLNAPVRKGPTSGQPEYLHYDPQTGKKRWTLVDESSFTSRDIAEFGEAIPPVAAAVAATGVAMTGVGAPGVGLAAGGAGALGEGARLAIGEIAGVNDVSAPQYVTDTLETGLYEMLLGWGGEKFMRLMQSIRKVFQPLATTADDAADILKTIENSNAKQLANDIESMARTKDPNATFRPTTAEQANEESLLAIEAGALSGDRHAAIEVGERTRLNESTLETAFDAITLQSDDGGTAYLAAKEVQQVAEGMVETRAEKAGAGMAGREAAAKEATEQLAVLDAQEGGRRMRAGVLAARQVAKTKETNAYNTYKQAYGWDGHAASNVKIQKTDRWNNFWAGVKQEKINAWFGHQKSAKGKIIPIFEGASKADDTIKLYDADGAVLSEFSKSADEPLDLHQLEEGLRALRKLHRGKKPGSADAHDIQRAIKELEILRRDGVTPEILELAARAENAAFDRIHVADKGLLNSIIAEKNGRYILNDTKLFAHVLTTNDKELAEQFMRVIEQDPGAVAATRRAFSGYYKEFAGKGGYIDPVLHEQFMRKHSHTINAVFTPAEIRRMNNLSNLGEIVKRSELRYQNLLKDLEKTFYGKIKNTNPEYLAEMIFSTGKKKGTGFSVGETGQLIRMMDRAGYGDHIRRAVGDYIKNKAFTAGVVQFAPLSNLASGATRNKLSAIYGAGYVRDIDTILNAKIMISRKPNKPVPWHKTNALTDFLRVVISPPLTRRGRAQTLFVNMRYDAANRALARALLDPKELERIVRLGNHQSNSRFAARTLGYFGAGITLQDVNDWNDEFVERNIMAFEKALNEDQ
jgi:hypothetical protein